MKRIFLMAIMFLPVLFLNLTFPNLAFSQDKRENMVDVGGYNLHCRVFGKGAPALVLVNGANSVSLGLMYLFISKNLRPLSNRFLNYWRGSVNRECHISYERMLAKEAQ